MDSDKAVVIDLTSSDEIIMASINMASTTGVKRRLEDALLTSLSEDYNSKRNGSSEQQPGGVGRVKESRARQQLLEYCSKNEKGFDLTSSSPDHCYLEEIRRKERHEQDGMEEMDFPVFDSHGGDNAILTDGIAYLAEHLLLPDTALCSGFGTNLSDKSVGIELTESYCERYPSRQLLHFTQNDHWSCGFRSTQMVLSALLPNLSPNHPLRSRTSHCYYRTIPSLYQLQSFLEQSWMEGFDAEGAKHYHHSIRGKKSKIGAVEVSTLFAYLHIDSVVVQFIECLESRELLGEFVWHYFTKKGQSCYFCSVLHDDGCRTQKSLLLPFSSSTTHAMNLLHYLAPKQQQQQQQQQQNGKEVKETEICWHPLLPLYLQWEGHSVAIVGIEKVANGGKEGASISGRYNLLVFDSMKKGSVLHKSLLARVSSKKDLQSVRDDYIVGSVRYNNNNKDGDDTNSLDWLAMESMRLPASDLLQKDCQILLSSPTPLSHEDREKAKKQVNALTAASTFVARSLEQREALLNNQQGRS